MSMFNVLTNLKHLLFSLKTPGFKAYLGMLWLDVTQNNPVLRTFVHILNDLKNEKCGQLIGVNSFNVECKEQSIPLSKGKGNTVTDH